LGDLRQEGALAALVVAALQAEPHADDAARRWQSVRDRFDWSVLAPAYAAMFHRVAGLSI
jgi:hypothetical protein